MSGQHTIGGWLTERARTTPKVEGLVAQLFTWTNPTADSLKQKKPQPPLLVLLWVLAPAIVLGTVFQQAAGWPFTPPQVVGPIAGFVALGAAATATLVPTLRGLHTAARAG